MDSDKLKLDKVDSVKLKLDDPPYSRLFIVCSKNTTEDELRRAFQDYGTIEQIWVVKDTITKEPKGITYIKFSKTSEAALALEEMNGRCIGSQSKPLHIRIAQSRDHGSKHEVNEEETLLRLFCVVPKTTTDQMLHDHFKQFGALDYVSVVKDRETKDSKGVAYVKFNKFSAAAKAFEGCDRLYKAVFAKPKSHRSPLEAFDSVSGQSSMMGYGTALSPFNTNGSNLTGPEGFRALTVIAPPSLSQNNLWRLFDLVPGLNFLKLDTKSRPGHAVAMYNNSEAAAYALKKLHGFEYPPGQRLIVKPEFDRHHSNLPLPPLYRGVSLGRDSYTSSTALRLPLSADLQTTPRHLALKTDLGILAKMIAQAKSILQSAGLTQDSSKSAYDSSYSSVKFSRSLSTYSLDSEMLKREDVMEIEPYSTARPSSSIDRPTAGSRSSSLQTNFAALTEAIAQATSIIQGLAKGETHETNNTSYCSVSLPGPQPLAPPDAETAERLFVVCNPQPPPPYVMRDVFSRFGNLVDVHMLNGKNYGYVKYASKESAEQAIQTLHGKEICGILIKVKTADPPGDTSRKRIRVVDD